MTEDQILDAALAKLDESGGAAYQYLMEHWAALSAPTSQAWNYRYCLAALAGEREAALSALETAILNCGLWYRPDVFEDSDLDTLRNDPRFARCVQVSQARYEVAAREAKPLLSWKEKTRDRLAVALHGNQQNAAMAREAWSFLEAAGYQLETLQSGTVDCAGLYRWENDDPEQSADLLAGLQGYRDVLLCGFSAGCGELLKTLTARKDVPCTRLVLASAWAPQVETEGMAIAKQLAEKRIAVTLLCGTQDEDCLPLAQLLAQALAAAGNPAQVRYVEGLGHALPEDLANWLTPRL